MTKNNKINLRDEFLSIRAKISEKARKLKSREVCKNFYSNISIKPQSKIAVYIPLSSEVDIKLLTEMYLEEGHIICLPCVDEANAPMVFREYKKGCPLLRNKLTKTLEPPTNFPTVIPDLVITPLVAFDAKGNRLGMGGGYYDRTFEEMNKFAEFIAVGTAFKEQQAGFVSTEATDYKLDAIVTDERVLVTS